MMNYAEYISRISFRLIKPRTRIPISENHYNELLEKIMASESRSWLERLGTAFEFINTAIPEDGAAMKKRLKSLCAIPKMSTLALGAMINRGVKQMAPEEAFVNVGVWHGFTFLAGMADNADKICVGVDNFSEFGGPRVAFLRRFEARKSPNHNFYDMDGFQYLEKVHKSPIGFYIYDGYHSYESQLRGLEAAEPFFSKRCIVLVDDTNWQAPRQATMDFISKSPHQYQILLDAGTRHNCHPTLWNGVIIFQKVSGGAQIG